MNRQLIFLCILVILFSLADITSGSRRGKKRGIAGKVSGAAKNQGKKQLDKAKDKAKDKVKGDRDGSSDDRDDDDRRRDDDDDRRRDDDDDRRRDRRRRDDDDWDDDDDDDFDDYAFSRRKGKRVKRHCKRFAKAFCNGVINQADPFDSDSQLMNVVMSPFGSGSGMGNYNMLQPRSILNGYYNRNTVYMRPFAMQPPVMPAPYMPPPYYYPPQMLPPTQPPTRQQPQQPTNHKLTIEVDDKRRREF